MAKKTQKTPPLKAAQRANPPMTNAGRVSELEQLDPLQYEQMLAYIRAGAYDTIAAKSLGVTPRTFARWKALGAEHEAEDVESPYRQFFLDVMKASGQARVIAETEVKKISPITWLRSGPGRPKENEEGWTEETNKVIHEGGENAIMVDHVHRVLGESPNERVDAIAGAFQVFQELGISPDKVTDIISQHQKELSEEEQMQQDYEQGKLIADHKVGYQPDSTNGNGKH